MCRFLNVSRLKISRTTCLGKNRRSRVFFLSKFGFRLRKKLFKNLAPAPGLESVSNRCSTGVPSFRTPPEHVMREILHFQYLKRLINPISLNKLRHLYKSRYYTSQISRESVFFCSISKWQQARVSFFILG